MRRKGLNNPPPQANTPTQILLWDPTSQESPDRRPWVLEGETFRSSFPSSPLIPISKPKVPIEQSHH